MSLEKVAAPNDKLFISVITYMEVLSYQFSNKVEKQIIEELCKNLPVIELNKEIVDKVIQVRQHHKIKLPDAIILATALVNKFELITADVSDFSNIHKGLVIINPMDS